MAETVVAGSLIGRRRQLERVGRWVVELSAGRGRAALIEGEPGIGKTTLLRATAADAAAHGCEVLWASCDELSRVFPLVPLLDAVDSGRRAGRPGFQIAELLRAEATPGQRVDVVGAAVERLLAAVEEACAVAPVLLVVDDLHFADPATVLTLGRLARAVRQLPLLMVAGARPVPRRDDLAALRRAVEPPDLMRLDSLSSPEVAEFVARVVGGPPGPRLLRLAEGAGGNPLYLAELLDALARGRALVRDEGGIEATVGRQPESLAAAIVDRLAFLSEPARAVLQAAALLGVDFAVSDLAIVSGRRVADLLPVIDEAILAGVLRGNGSDLAFRHPLIRSALYGEMLPAVRAAWHRDAGRALAEYGAQPERVARQLLPALEIQDAGVPDDWIVLWLEQTGQQLVGQAPHAAVPLLRHAVAGMAAGAAPYDLLICRLADALYRVGDAAEAAQVANGALAHVTRPHLVVDLHCTLAACRAMEGRSAESLPELERAANAPGIGPSHRARLLVLTARTHLSLGEVDAADRIAAQARAAATQAGDRWATGWALGLSTMIHAMRGASAQAMPLFEQALAVAEGHPGLTDLRLVLQLNQASVLGDLDRYDEAITAAVQARQLADDAGNLVRLAQAQSVLAELLFDVGRWDDALAEVEAPFGATKHPFAECCDRGVAAIIRLHRGDPFARQDLDEGNRIAAGLERVSGSFTLAKSLEREHAEAPREALAVLLAGLSGLAEEMGEAAALFADAVRIAVATGDRATARSIASQAVAIAETSDVPHLIAVGPHCRGLLDRDPALLVESAGFYAAASRPLPRAQALEAAGVALAGRGELVAARARFTDAFAIFTELAAAWDIARAQATFRSYGIRRGPRVRHRRADHGWESLTPTELKIVELVAQGMSNPEIARHLFLSRRTVQTHVSHVLAKLNLHSRIDIAREASRRDAASD
ncbi:MAG TPA: AAA family ATPase [Micromonosporaceae bacterium]|nr:AAA family ATPase [Micromonosporaceae bacterium]